MKTQSPKPKSPARVAAGRRNRQLRRGLTVDGRERLRQAAVRNRPWEKSTGPITATGKAKVRLNGRLRQIDPMLSIREARSWSKDVDALLEDLRENYAAFLLERD